MNYYKILNVDEKHYEMQYKTGLNTDVKPFDPSGNCQPGGIYFADKDILAFLRYGPWLRKVTIPKGEEVYENPSKFKKKYKAHRVILGEREKITPQVIKRLIKEGADVHAWNDDALCWAVERGHLEIIKLLLKCGVNVHARNGFALRWATEKGYLEVVKLLLKYGADVHADDDGALRWAARNGHLKVVKLLLEYGANVYESNYALYWAAKNRHSEVVELLKKYGADHDKKCIDFDDWT